jgi:hypothetical protein
MHYHSCTCDDCFTAHTRKKSHIEDLRLLVEEFIRRSPSFPGDSDIAKKIGTAMANVEKE